jgi:hypothetical protein
MVLWSVHGPSHFSGCFYAVQFSEHGGGGGRGRELTHRTPSLREKGAPRVIPNLCVLPIKNDENLCPLCAKSCIIVLGNHEDRVLKKSNKFAPVLCQNSLHFLTSMAVASCVPFVRVIVKTLSVRASSLQMRLLLFAPLAVIPKPPLMNIGSLNG